jgi:hypothetical protein
MRHDEPGAEGPEFFHMMFGAVDDDCPVCRAHGLSGEEPGEVLRVFEIRGLEALLSCPCPLCTRAAKLLRRDGDECGR